MSTTVASPRRKTRRQEPAEPPAPKVKAKRRPPFLKLPPRYKHADRAQELTFLGQHGHYDLYHLAISRAGSQPYHELWLYYADDDRHVESLYETTYCNKSHESLKNDAYCEAMHRAISMKLVEQLRWPKRFKRFVLPPFEAKEEDVQRYTKLLQYVADGSDFTDQRVGQFNVNKSTKVLKLINCGDLYAENDLIYLRRMLATLGWSVPHNE